MVAPFNIYHLTPNTPKLALHHTIVMGVSTSAEQFLQKFTKASFPVLFQHQQGNILYQPGLLDRIETIVPAPHHPLAVEQKKILRVRKSSIGANIGHAGLQLVDGEIVNILLVAGDKPPAFVIAGITVREFSQCLHRIVFGVDADGDELHDAVFAVGIGLLQFLHASGHTGADGGALGEKEIDHQDFVFYGIEGNNLTELVHQPDIAHAVPLGIGYRLPPFCSGAHAVVKVAQGHMHGLSAVILHGIIACKGKQDRDAQAQYRSFVHFNVFP